MIVLGAVVVALPVVAVMFFYLVLNGGICGTILRMKPRPNLESPGIKRDKAGLEADLDDAFQRVVVELRSRGLRSCIPAVDCQQSVECRQALDCCFCWFAKESSIESQKMAQAVTPPEGIRSSLFSFLDGATRERRHERF